MINKPKDWQSPAHFTINISKIRQSPAHLAINNPKDRKPFAGRLRRCQPATNRINTISFFFPVF
ncbi:MAG: hypothetical protein LBU34_10100 [Planctomycetaceae bacterium]|nr:hypothetical protein [Planctomycetaceae bacterium]